MSERAIKNVKTTILTILFLVCCYFAPEIFGQALFVFYSVTIFPIQLLAQYTDHMGFVVMSDALVTLNQTVVFIFIGLAFIGLPILVALGRVQGEGFSSSGSLGFGQGVKHRPIFKIIDRFFLYSVWVSISLFTIYGFIVSVVIVKYSVVYTLVFIIPFVGGVGLALKKKWANIYCALLYLAMAAIFVHSSFISEPVIRNLHEIATSIVLAIFLGSCSSYLVKKAI